MKASLLQLFTKNDQIAYPTKVYYPWGSVACTDK